MQRYRGIRSGLVIAITIVLAALPASGARAQGAAAGERHALVIGIDRYTRLGDSNQLTAAKRDATDMAALLAKKSFKIVGGGARHDPPQKLMKELWREFLGAIKPGDMALFYFSGHGFEELGQNFLIPSDMAPLPPGNRSQVGKFLEDEAVSLGTLLADFTAMREEFKDKGKDGKKGDFFGVFIIDACRDTPASQTGGARWAGTKNPGLSPVSDPGGNFIFYAAEARQQALDRIKRNDPNPNSVYTRFLLPLLDRTEFSLSDIAQIIKQRVYNEAQKRLDDNERPIPHTQIPAYYDGFLGRRNILGTEMQLQEEAFDKALAENRLQPDRAAMTTKIAFAKSLQAELDAAPADQRAERPVLPTQKDCPKCPELIVVPGKPFRIGAGEREDAPDHERPNREIKLGHVYAIGKFEVTVGEWEACVRTTACPSVRTGYKLGEDHDVQRRPIVNVSWNQAQSYVKWLTKETGFAYRLPSEAEWEFAARAGSEARYFFGEEIDRLCMYANGADRGFKSWLFPGNETCADKHAAVAAPVGSYKPNDYGLYDVHGNVWEMVQDCYSSRLADLPEDGHARDGDKDCTVRTARGGSWMSGPDALRSSARNAFGDDHQRSTLGFRVVRTMTEGPP